MDDRLYNSQDFQSDQVNSRVFCEFCNKYLVNQKGYYKHVNTKLHNKNVRRYYGQHPPLDTTRINRIPNEFNINIEGIEIVSSFQNDVAVQFLKKGPMRQIDVGGFLETLKLYREHVSNKPFKFYFGITSLYNKNNSSDIITMHYNATLAHITSSDQIEGEINRQVRELQTRLDEEELEGSGFQFLQIESIKLDVGLYRSNAGGSYIELPFKSNVILNIQNYDDDYCFFWSILAYYFPVDSKDHPNRVNNYEPYLNRLNLDGLNIPMNVNMFKIFQKNNPQVLFNVFEVNSNKKISMLFRTHLDPKGCNLFLFNGHFVLCKNVNVFLNNNPNSHHETFSCLNCLCSFYSTSKLESHQRLCVEHKPSEATFPKDDYKYFKEYEYKNKVPFVVYGDFEAWNKVELLRPESNNSLKSETLIDNSLKSGTLITQKPFCFGLYIKSNYPSLLESYYYEYCGEDCLQHFVQCMMMLNNSFQDLLKYDYGMQLTYEDEINFQNATECYYCKSSFEPLSDKKINSFANKFQKLKINHCKENVTESIKFDRLQSQNFVDKVRDHDHYKIGYNYRGAAHNSCNLRAKNQFVPIYFHNGSRYDNHLFFEELMKTLPVKETKVLASTEENYISFEYGCLRFLDSYRFMPFALDYLSSLLKPEECSIFNSQPDVNILKNKKGIYPYEYIKGYEIRDICNIMHQTQLPSKEQFYSHLKQQELSDDDYTLAHKNWNLLKCNNMYDYTMKYLKIDVCLLADVYENFRNKCLQNYDIDPCYCYSTPGLTWLAGLKFTNVRLKYFKEETYDQLLFFENGIRGGVASPLGNRIVKANNEFTNPKLSLINFKIKRNNVSCKKNFHNGSRYDNHLFFEELIKTLPVKETKSKKIFQHQDLPSQNLESGLRKRKGTPKKLVKNYLHSVDANSLYPTGMVQDLPNGEMWWSDYLVYEKTSDMVSK